MDEQEESANGQGRVTGSEVKQDKEHRSNEIVQEYNEDEENGCWGSDQQRLRIRKKL